jgi:hypothetical protein
MVPGSPSATPSWPVRRGPFATLQRADWIGLAVLAGALSVIDSVFLAMGRHDANVGLFVLWCCIQALICVAGGAFQGFRGRRWWEIIIVGSIAAVLLAFIVLVVANPDPGSADCASQNPCDTSFGLGALVISIITVPVYTAVAAVGRALGGLVTTARGRAT